METIKLGKISEVEFGFQEYLFGLQLVLEGPGWGVQTSYSWNASEWTPHCQWSRADQKEGYVWVCENVQKLLRAAKVEKVSALKGKPVEVVFEGMLLKSFRILEEVL